MFLKVMSSIVIGIMMMLIVIGYFGVVQKSKDKTFDILIGLFELSYTLSLFAIWC